MRKIIAPLIAGLAGLLASTACAQVTTHADSLRAAGYLFPDFVNGTVLMKSGGTVNTRLNYNTNNQEMGFMKAGQYMELTDLETIDTVYVYEMKFVPYHEKFYMVAATSTGLSLLALIYNKPVPQTATVEHSGSEKRSTASVSNVMTNAYISPNFWKSYFELTYQKKFFLQKGKMLLKASSQREVINIYPEKEDAIRNFVRKNKTNFYQENDVAELLVAMK